MRSLRNKLFVTVSALVIISGLLISFLVTQRYNKSLFRTAKAQAENLAHELALDATDKILINDLVTLQKMLEDKKRSNPSFAYIFIIRNHQLLAHTFTNGIPVELISANDIIANDHGHFQKIASTSGDRFLDIAWPIFSGKAGILRVGLTETPIRDQINQLWLQMSTITLVILVIALVTSFLFIRRITGPLAVLSEAVENIDEKHLEIGIKLKSHDEVGRLASSFNKMIARIKEYTLQLEEKAVELDRAHNQIRSCFAIVQEIGSMPNLNDIVSYLIKKFQNILECQSMVLLVYTGNSDSIFVLSDNKNRIVKDKPMETAVSTLRGLENITTVSSDSFTPPIVPEDFISAKHIAVFPLNHENQFLGAMLVACTGECQDETKAMELLDLILNQTSGAIKRAALQEEEIRNLQNRIESISEYSGIIGKDSKIQAVYKLIEDIAPTDASVLIQGESGTGKELVAHAIHRQSLRNDRPFIVVNCSAYPATLLESELFGHEKGAFTGAIRQKAGRFEQAHSGTVFLDEIGEIPPSAQIKLLRVLQSQKFERLGGEQTLSVDFRILAATNKDLLQEVKNGSFREDLFYRLNVIPIFIPPLRKRGNDIPLLSRHFLKRFSAEQAKDVKEFSSDAMRLLLDYSWPGNVRELENAVEHATVLAKGRRIEVADLPTVLHHPHISSPDESSHGTIQKNEISLLRDVLEECNWNKKEAARRLGISRGTLYNKLKKYQIEKVTYH